MYKYTRKTLSLSLLALIALLLIPSAYAQEDIIPDSSFDVAQADTEEPSEVQNVQATGGDGKVDLTWNVATDDNLVAGYKIYYGTSAVKEPGDMYDLPTIDAGNKISYEVTGLENGTTYYFAVTAYDEATNESVNYSVEASATPSAVAADSVAPTVVKAEAIDKYTALVTFSEAVKLPSEAAQSAFSIMEDVTSVSLDVLAAAINVDDSTGKSVLLTTSEQKAGSTYILTGGIQIKDKAGNSIQSGTSDTAIFAGTDMEPKMFAAADEEGEDTEDVDGPQLIDVQVPDNTHVKIAFSEVVVLGSTPTLSFVITEEENIQNILQVLDATLDEGGTIVTLTTDPQTAMNYNLIVMEDITDEFGNMIDVANNATVFFGSGEAAEEGVPDEETDMVDPTGDMTAPEDASDLKAKLLENMAVALSWTPSANTAGDLANYILYKSTDGNVYGGGVVLNATDTVYNVEGLVSDVKYFFKLTVKDAAGNESDGIIASFMLPGTGPELGLLLLGSAGLGRLLRKKKKNKK